MLTTKYLQGKIIQNVANHITRKYKQNTHKNMTYLRNLLSKCQHKKKKN